MKKLLLSTAALLFVAATILGGYYYYGNDLLAAMASEEFQPENLEATDNGVPFKRRGGAWFDENGNIAVNSIANALAQRERYLLEHMPPDGFGDKGDGSGIPEVPSTWVPRGPQNLGGRTEAILVHPINPDILWAGGASGGVWKSYDGGNTWNAMNGTLGNFNVSCLALDPGDATGNTLYAGTGAQDLRGDGIFKSTDGGMNWVRLDDTHDRHWKYVSSISVVQDDNQNTVILAAMESDSTDELADHGIMRSADGGDTWAKVKDASFGVAVAVDQYDPSKAVASVCYKNNYTDVNLRDKCKVFSSANYGLTWSESYLGSTNTNPGPNPPLFESPRARDTIHFALRGSMIYAQYGDARPTVISKSTNGGGYFSTQGLGSNPEGINIGVPAFWVSPALNPTDPDSTVVITGGAFLYRSMDGAKTFQHER